MKDRIEDIVFIAITAERQRLLNELLVWCGNNRVDVTSLASKIAHMTQSAPRDYEQWRKDCDSPMNDSPECNYPFNG